MGLHPLILRHSCFRALLGKVAEVAGTATPGKAGEVSGNRSGSAVQKKGPKHLPEAVTDFVNSIFGDSFIGRTVAGLVLKVVDWVGLRHNIMMG